MKILREGPEKPRFVYNVTCPACDSLLEFDESDMKLHDAGRNETEKYVVCLKCERKIFNGRFSEWRKIPVPPPPTEIKPRPPFRP